MTPEEFQSYIENQQKELEAEGLANKPAAKPKSKRVFSFDWLVYTIPFFAVLAFTFCSWDYTTKMSASKRSAFWDKILGSTAKATGRKYNSNAQSLTERFTFGK